MSQLPLWVGLLIGGSGLAAAFLAYALVRVGTRKPRPPYVPGEGWPPMPRAIPPPPAPPPEPVRIEGWYGGSSLHHTRFANNESVQPPCPPRKYSEEEPFDE